MRLFLVRHGETEPNRLGIALGRKDVPLTETGVRQARRLADALAREPLVAVYSSPLERTLKTAETIAEPHGVGVVIEERLIEMDVGHVDGLTYQEIREQHPEFLDRWMSETGPQHPMPGGERLVDVAERAWGALSELSKRHQGETIVAVTHNFVILCLLATVMGLELANFRRLRHGVAAITALDVRPDRARVLTLNDTCHLEE